MTRTPLKYPFLLGPTALAVLEVIMRAASPPSIVEIAAKVGCQVKTVQQHLDRLKDHGLISFQCGRARTARAKCHFVEVA